MPAVSLEAGEGETIAEHVDCLELGKREILVVVLVGSIVIGIKRVEVDHASGEQRKERAVLTGVLEVGLRTDQGE